MTNKRAARQRGGNDLSEAAWAWLNDALTDDIGTGWERYDLECDQSISGTQTNAALWRDYGAAVMSRWIVDYPGTRPSLWWRYDAPRRPLGDFAGTYLDGTLPVPRKRVGGIGKPLHEVLAYVPHFYLGVPTFWPTPQTGDYPDAPGVVPIDENNPPTFESQASWLKRLGLLLPREADRLKRRDFAPESVLDILAGKPEFGASDENPAAVGRAD